MGGRVGCGVDGEKEPVSITTSQPIDPLEKSAGASLLTQVSVLALAVDSSNLHRYGQTGAIMA